MSRCKVEYRTTQKDVYKRFKEKYPQFDVDFNTWANIIYTFNYAYRDHMLETGERVKFVHGFGDFAITKWRPNQRTYWGGVERINFPVDWKKTRENGGKKIYHMNYNTEGFRFKWKWFTNTGRFFLSGLWNFKPSRVTSRLLKHYLSLPDYQYKYLEWK